ncbi:hypothetical protein [Hyphococcus luteus]|uniref:Uncharacterized protein n=1 Tax=Hyphococcus luteus TaxID=2058213 RepID=A0A2S7JZG0_9PROT|nr:hypothetical protein [Marinicaulis flavus]PQA85622.1 hypothetical protein CW354_22075 [Marinicaulis flavus]
MRKSLLTSIAAISASAMSMGAAHAAPEPLPAELDSAALLAEEGPAPEEEARSALSAILARFITVETKAEVTRTAAAEHPKGGCPKEAEKLSEADGASEDKDKKKQLVGPEPIYFAF